MISLISLAVLLLLVLLAYGYTPRPARAASGGSISVPSQWHAGHIGRIRIGTYNIHRCRGADGQYDISRVAEVMRGADIVGLQEVGMAGWGEPQVAMLGRFLDLGWLYLPTRQRWFHNDRGNGLLSVFPANHWHSERLPYSARRTPRTLASTRLLVGDKELWVLITHLNTREGRAEQLKLVLDRFSHYNPAILLADLNTTPDDPIMLEYLQHEEVVDALAITLGETHATQRVDWILTRGLEIRSGQINENIASDHPYYSVEVELT